MKISESKSKVDWAAVGGRCKKVAEQKKKKVAEDQKHCTGN